MSDINPTDRPLTPEEIDAALGYEGATPAEPQPEPKQAESLPSKLTPAQEINEAIKVRWYEHMVGVCQNASKTIDTRKNCMIIFDRWLAARLVDKTYLTLVKDEIRLFVQFCIDKGDRPLTVMNRFNAIKSLYNFIVEEEGLLDKNPCPNKARVRKQHEGDTLIKYADVMQCRNNANDSIGIDRTSKVPTRRNVLSSLRRYTAFEVLLSTGMTVSELNRVNVNDVNFDDTLFDKELNCESPYVHGSITLDPQLIGVKKRRFRKVYLSPLASKLLKLHIYHNGLHDDIPLFPWPTGTLENWMKKISIGVLKEKPLASTDHQPHNTNKKVRRSKYKTEVYIDPNSKVSSEVKAAIEKQQARAVLRDQYEVKAEYKYKVKVAALYPHALRHVCSCAMMYRSWIGTRNDVVKVKEILGHSLRSTKTFIYLDHYQYLKSDREWINLFCGNPKSYWRMLHLLEEFDPIKIAALPKKKSHHKKGSKYNP